jgi:hypothetical protein
MLCAHCCYDLPLYFEVVTSDFGNVGLRTRQVDQTSTLSNAVKRCDYLAVFCAREVAIHSFQLGGTIL